MDEILISEVSIHNINTFYFNLKGELQAGWAHQHESTRTFPWAQLAAAHSYAAANCLQGTPLHACSGKLQIVLGGVGKVGASSWAGPSSLT